eukprot:13394826-Heterocapsa_arctica.AAC.1
MRALQQSWRRSSVEGLPWRVASYNAQRANSHLRIAQGTQEKQKVLDKQHLCEWRRSDDYDIYSWPWEAGQPYTKSSCGVKIAVRTDRARRGEVQHILSPSQTLQGRAGGIIILRRG